jgi:plastocyanin
VSRLAGIATALAVLGVALAALAATLPAGSGPLGPGRAEAAECAWKRHTKRVVKQVRRNGRARRVVRKRHRWTCVPVGAPVPAAPVAALPAPAPPAPPLVGEPEPEPEANRLAVKAAEFYFVLSRPSVRAGAVTIELDNRGEDPHNLNIRPEGEEGAPLEIPETASLQRSVAGFDLAAGKYRLWCSLPEHEEKGMQTTLVVG